MNLRKTEYLPRFTFCLWGGIKHAASNCRYTRVRSDSFNGYNEWVIDQSLLLVGEAAYRFDLLREATTTMVMINPEEEVKGIGRDELFKELYQKGGEEERSRLSIQGLRRNGTEKGEAGRSNIRAFMLIDDITTSLLRRR